MSKLTEKQQDSADSNASYRHRKFEALCLILSDRHGPGALAPMTLDELDLDPITKDLPDEDKMLLVKHWAGFQRDQTKANEIIALRRNETELAMKAQKGALVIADELGLNQMPISDRLIVTARVFHTQIAKSALALAATDLEDIHTDPMLRELFKNRVGYVKAFLGIARDLLDLADRIRESDNDVTEQGLLPAEIKDALNQADALLMSKGIPIAGQDVINIDNLPLMFRNTQ